MPSAGIGCVQISSIGGLDFRIRQGQAFFLARSICAAVVAGTAFPADIVHTRQLCQFVFSQTWRHNSLLLRCFVFLGFAGMAAAVTLVQCDALYATLVGCHMLPAAMQCSMLVC